MSRAASRCPATAAASRARPVLQLGDEVHPSAEPCERVAWCRERLAGYKLPKTVDVVDELPRNPPGKILERELRACRTGRGPTGRWREPFDARGLQADGFRICKHGLLRFRGVLPFLAFLHRLYRGTRT